MQFLVGSDSGVNSAAVSIERFEESGGELPISTEVDGNAACVRAFPAVGVPVGDTVKVLEIGTSRSWSLPNKLETTSLPPKNQLAVNMIATIMRNGNHICLFFFVDDLIIAT